MESDEQMRARRAAAYQAWWEHQPVRVPRARSWADLNIVRSIDWGALAKFWVLDSRQYRSDQACGDIYNAKVPCGDGTSPRARCSARARSGGSNRDWPRRARGGRSSRTRRCSATIDYLAGADRGLSMDSWTGYPAARARMVRAIAQHAPNRTVVITGDNHANWVHEIRGSGPAGVSVASAASGATVAAEFVGTSISSGGDGSERSTSVPDSVLSENPTIKWQNNRRGYVVCEVTPDAWRTEFRTVPFVTRPDAPVETPTKWRLTHGRAGVERE